MLKSVMLRGFKLVLLTVIALWAPAPFNTSSLASHEPQTTVLQNVETSREIGLGAKAQKNLDPAAWRGNHAGKPNKGQNEILFLIELNLNSL